MAYDAQKSLLKDAFLAAVEAVQPHHFMTDVAAAVTARFGTKLAKLTGVGQSRWCDGGCLSCHWRACGDTLIMSCPMLCQLRLPDHFKIYHSAHPVPDEPANKRVRPCLTPPRRWGQMMQAYFPVIRWGLSAGLSLGPDGISCRKATGE